MEHASKITPQVPQHDQVQRPTWCTIWWQKVTLHKRSKQKADAGVDDMRRTLLRRSRAVKRSAHPHAAPICQPAKPPTMSTIADRPQGASPLAPTEAHRRGDFAPAAKPPPLYRSAGKRCAQSAEGLAPSTSGTVTAASPKSNRARDALRLARDMRGKGRNRGRQNCRRPAQSHQAIAPVMSHTHTHTADGPGTRNSETSPRRSATPAARSTLLDSTASGSTLCPRESMPDASTPGSSATWHRDM